MMPEPNGLVLVSTFTIAVADQVWPGLREPGIHQTESAWVLLAPGFADTPDRMAAAVTLARVSFPYLPMISLVAFWSAIANAENNPNLDVDELIVAEAWVGKNLIMKRGRPRARGRFGKIHKPFSELTIKVRQVEEQA